MQQQPMQQQPMQQQQTQQVPLPQTEQIHFEAEPVQPYWMLTGGYEAGEYVTGLDYDIRGLQKRRTLIKGELVSTEYFTDHNLSDGEYTGLCVKETNYYLRQQDVVYCRLKEIVWYLSDGSVGNTKSTKKTYEFRDGIAEGVVRRKNVYEDAKIKAIELLGIMQATDLLSAFSSGLSLYWEGNKHNLLLALRDLQRPYLTPSARQALLEILLIDDTMAQWGL